MHPQSLGYFGTTSGDLGIWKEFGTGLIGLEMVEKSSSTISFRMDDWKQRIIVDKGLAEGQRFVGWEVANAEALNALASFLDDHDVRVAREPTSVAAARCVSDLISFFDPAGNRLECFHGPQVHDKPFKPGRSISGFRTGIQGLGHIVLTVENIEAVMPFYVDLLGFKLSDYMVAPFKAYFFHLNSRHHSLALVETGQNGMHHLMLEYFSLDDVGQGYDIAQVQDRVGVTLGRHTNDFMTSFYARTPSTFMIECGWGGRAIDTAGWQPFELRDGPSMWGHERSWLPPEKREEARRIRMAAAAQGRRQPVQVLSGNYHQMTGTCPWWDATKSGRAV